MLTIPQWRDRAGFSPASLLASLRKNIECIFNCTLIVESIFVLVQRIKLDFTNGFNNMPNGATNPNPDDSIWTDQFFNKFKVVDSQISQEIAGIPTVVITFTR